jgi:hypothetical protein
MQQTIIGKSIPADGLADLFLFFAAQRNLPVAGFKAHVQAVARDLYAAGGVLAVRVGSPLDAEIRRLEAQYNQAAAVAPVAAAVPAGITAQMPVLNGASVVQAAPVVNPLS